MIMMMMPSNLSHHSKIEPITDGIRSAKLFWTICPASQNVSQNVLKESSESLPAHPYKHLPTASTLMS